MIGGEMVYELLERKGEGLFTQYAIPRDTLFVMGQQEIVIS